MNKLKLSEFTAYHQITEKNNHIFENKTQITTILTFKP